MLDMVATLASEFNWDPRFIKNTLLLLEDDNTIPFIARYRKEQTGSLDEVQLRDLRDRAQYLKELEERRQVVLESVESQGKLTEELKKAILNASTKQTLEDIYLPYRPKRRTRATIAREKGLEPLARALLSEPVEDAAADRLVEEFIAAFEGEISAEEVLAGCRDILAEEVAEDADTRSAVRRMTRERGSICSTVVKEFQEQKTRFNDYYEYEEPLRKIPAHRYLALRRGETEKVLRVRINAPEEEISVFMAEKWRPAGSERVRRQWDELLHDSYSRLIAPAVEVELRVEMKEAADTSSISIFAENLSSLLLQPPGGSRVVLGLDPGFRTGSKWVVVDHTGKLLEHGTIYPLPPQNKVEQSAAVLNKACVTHGVNVIAVGNGTASRELLEFVRQTVSAAGLDVQNLMVNESGASVYSASDIAREEFPELDLTIRGAISIARRFQDPLAELVKIDPKSLGVGQYQHDVMQSRLKMALDETVESCVNRVGVNLNTASWALLRYVSGLSVSQAKEIVSHRDRNGPFPGREVLGAVSRLGPKAFQQCAGFLRIPNGRHPLDNSAVHPEHYGIVERMAADLGVELGQMVGNLELIGKIDPGAYVCEEAGLPTLHDILTELRKPGRDPREARDLVRFNEAITEIGHLKEGMTLDGIVTNITHFGAFVDIGVHCDGLVHVSQLADRFVKDPGEVVQVGKPVQVWVVSVDVERMRISLSMRKQGDGKQGDEKQRDGKQRDGKSGEKPPAKAHAGQPGQKRRPDGPSRGKPSGNRVADGAGPGKNQGAAEARPKDLKSVLSAINQKFGR